jgi:hypothetical protein
MSFQNPMIRSGVIFLICLATAGCASHPEQEKHPAQKALSKSDYEALREEFKAPSGGTVQRRGYPIKQGTPPLAVLVPAQNSVRVINATNGALVAMGSTKRDAIVSVDVKAGVTLGRDKLARGPLPSAESYSIYIEAVNPNVVVTGGTTLPAQHAPATQPVRQR